MDDAGYLQVDRGQETTTPGVYAIGDITGPPHLASIAAANGVQAALSLHRSLLPSDREL
jgi:dihydrolipoamide dehydrogenase